ncbi:MAG TPA: hypothetical protein VGZ48_08860 [Candidatus Acidoferrales bacterium]|jgi:hypothetical protein|nr:hypothetical protein [Candidatus Acidoferrales bacterium]
MGLFDSTSEDPGAKKRRYAIMAATGLVLGALAIYWLIFGYLHVPERKAATRFFDTLCAGNTELAYKLWQPSRAYEYKDFLDDWGPNGIYGPVKSYQIVTIGSPAKGGSGVIVIAEVSPFQPFPDPNDLPKARSDKEVRIWVESADKSLSYPPF